MKTARSILNATALGLLAFTFLASLVVGVTAPATQISFGLLVIYGVLEIAIISYAPRAIIARSTQPRPVVVRRTSPAVVDYPAYRKAA